MPISGRTVDIVVEMLAAKVERLSGELTAEQGLVAFWKETASGEQARLLAERDKWQKRAELCLEDDNKMAAERGEALRKLAEDDRRIAALEIERDGARKAEAWLQDQVAKLKAKLAQADGHNDILRGQNAQLQAALKKAGIKSLYLPPDWRKTVAENLRAQAIDDSAEPQFTAQELSDAKAIVKDEDEYQRTARGEPTTKECSACGGEGEYLEGDDEGQECRECHGTGRVLVKDGAPKHLDTAREGATDHAMSLADDTD